VTEPPQNQARYVVTAVPGAPHISQPGAAPSGYPSSNSGVAGYPAQTALASKDGRSQSALTSLKVAERIAKEEYDPEARLYAIIPSGIMISNLGRPPVLPGWFYKFKRENSRREFTVHVADGQATGTTLAEPAVLPDEKELPIELDKVKFDSPQVFKRFQAFAAKQNIVVEGKVFDLELTNIEGKGGPVWSVVDPETNRWLYSINAANGAEVGNPHS